MGCLRAEVVGVSGAGRAVVALHGPDGWAYTIGLPESAAEGLRRLPYVASVGAEFGAAWLNVQETPDGVGVHGCIDIPLAVAAELLQALAGGAEGGA